jgi:hypothetical protein
MEQSKFIRALIKLDQKQRQRYIDFLYSPYFNKNTDVRALVEAVIDPDAVLEKEWLYQKIYPGKTYEERRISDLMYLALKLLEDFLAEEQYAKQVWSRKLNLLGYIREQDVYELKNGVQRDISEIRQAKPYRDSEYFYEEFLYQSEADRIFLNQSRITEDQSLQKKVDQLDIFYLSAKLRDSCEMLNRERIVSARHEYHLLDSLVANITQNIERYACYPAISIYYNIYHMLTDTANESWFFIVKEEIFRSMNLFGVDEQRSLYGYLQNYSIRKLNSGQPEYYSELLEIYRNMIAGGLMNRENKNLQWDLKNMVAIALRLKEYEWTYNTIQQMKAELPPEVRDNAHTYYLANYYYETKDYKKATRLLHSVDFTDVYYNLDSKAMLLKIYYEQEEEEAFYALVAAFKAYLLRNKLVSEDLLVLYANLVKFARKAFAFKTQLPYQRKRNAKQIVALKDKITQTQQVANITWLMKEVEQLQVN